MWDYLKKRVSRRGRKGEGAKCLLVSLRALRFPYTASRETLSGWKKAISNYM